MILPERIINPASFSLRKFPTSNVIIPPCEKPINIQSDNFKLSELQYFNMNYNLVVPIFFIIISILLISKIPTYSLKRIVVPRSTSIFLLFGIILFFGLLLVFTFNTIVIAGFVYIVMVPASAIHFYTINKNIKDDDIVDHHEDIL